MTVMDKIVGVALAGILVTAIFVLLAVVPFMLLWNALMPVVFGLPTIGFWQSMGLLLFVRLLLPVHAGKSE